MIELSVASFKCQRFSVVTSLHGKITSLMSVHCFSTKPKLASHFLSKTNLKGLSVTKPNELSSGNLRHSRERSSCYSPVGAVVFFRHSNAMK